jgi:hypothetical protein
MFDDIKELIDLAAPPPNLAHREELWEQFQIAARPTTEGVSVLRPALHSANDSDMLALQRVESIDELVRRRNRRRVSSVLVLAAAIVTVAGVVAVNRTSNTVQVSPAMPNRNETTTAAATSEVPRVPATVTQSAQTSNPSSAPGVATTVANRPVSGPVTAAAGSVPAQESSATPANIIFYNYFEDSFVARGGWNGKSVVRVPPSVERGRYQTLSGTAFVLNREPDSNDLLAINPFMNPMMFLSETSWPVQPRPVRSPVTNLLELRDARFDIYREEARRLARVFGGADALPELLQVQRGDLDGDGTEEVLVSAKYYGDLREPAVVGRYSIAYVRHVVGDHAVSKVLDVVVSSKLIGDFVIHGVADIDGDGVMEVIAKFDSNDEIFVWDAGSADTEPKRLFKLGQGEFGS